MAAAPFFETVSRQILMGAADDRRATAARLSEASTAAWRTRAAANQRAGQTAQAREGPGIGPVTCRAPTGGSHRVRAEEAGAARRVSGCPGACRSRSLPGGPGPVLPAWPGIASGARDVMRWSPGRNAAPRRADPAGRAG